MKPETKVTLSYVVIAALPFGYFYPTVFADAQAYFEPSTVDWLSHLPSLAFLLTGLLGWQLNQTRILLSCLFLSYFYLLAQQWAYAPTLGMTHIELTQAMAIALPLALTLLYSFRESPLFSQRTLLRLLLACLPGALLVGLFGTDHASFLSLSRWHGIQGIGRLHLQLSHGALLALLPFTTQALLSRDAKAKPFMVALAVALWPILLSSESALGQSGPVSDFHRSVVTLCFLSASTILLWSIFSMYWHRVYLDELTGIPNRRALDEKLATLDGNYSLAMVDIDHFKKFNDSYGHEEGDNVLKLVARHLKDGSGARAYRYGGEEFCMVFEGWGSAMAEEHCDAIRDALAKREFSIRLPGKIRKKTGAGDRGSLHAKSATVQVTVSMGVAAPDKSHVHPHEVIKLADQGLYNAKEKGRNCVVRKN